MRPGKNDSGYEDDGTIVNENYFIVLGLFYGHFGDKRFYLGWCESFEKGSLNQFFHDIILKLHMPFPLRSAPIATPQCSLNLAPLFYAQVVAARQDGL